MAIKQLTEEQFSRLKQAYNTTYKGNDKAFKSGIIKKYGQEAYQNLVPRLKEFKAQTTPTQTVTQPKPTQPTVTPTAPTAPTAPTQTTPTQTTPTQPVTPTPTEAPTPTQTPTPTPTQTTTPTTTAPTAPSPIQVTAPTQPAETPAPIEAPTPTEAPKPITNIQEFKQAGANVGNLKQFIENRYGATANIEGNKVTSIIDGEKFQWIIDEAGNPIKESLGKVTTTPTPTPTAPTLTTEELTAQKQNTLNDFEKLLNSSPNEEEIKNFLNSNKQYATDLKGQLRIYFKNQANLDYFNKYSNYSAEDLYNAYAKGKIIVGNEQYNLLPNELRGEFENIKRLNEKNETGDVFSFEDYNKNVVDLSSILQQIQGMFSSNLKQNYYDQINSSEMEKLKSDMSSKTEEISKLDNEIKNLEDDIRARYPGVSEGFIQGILRRDSKALYRQRDDLVASYNVLSSDYSNRKSEIQFGYEIDKYEDSINRDNFKNALTLYQTERARMDKLEERQFEVNQNELTYQRNITMQKELIDYKAEIDKNKGGKYIDDGKGNLQYVKDGVIISTLSGLGESISQTTDKNLDFKFYQNDDGSYSAFTINKDTGKIELNNFNVNGDVAGGYIQTIGNGNITSYGGPHDNGHGLDIDGKIGDNIITPLGGTVARIQDLGDKSYGKNVLIRLDDGNFIRFSHLNGFNVKDGDRIERGDLVGTMGNTGNVVALQGDGSHVDITMLDQNKQFLNAHQVEDYLNKSWGGVTNKDNLTTKGLADSNEIKIITIGREAYGKNISDSESKRIESLIEKFPNASTRDIALAVRGLNIKESQNENIALNYSKAFDIMKAPNVGYENIISNYINNGDIEGLKSYTTKAIDNDLKSTLPADEFISTSSYKTQAESTARIINLIDKNKGSIGPTAGRITDLKKKFSKQEDYQKLQTEMTALLATLRKNFAGSAVTETELKALEDYVSGRTTENPLNLITKFMTLSDRATRVYVNQRQTYGVPIRQYKPKLISKQDLDFLNK